MKITTDSKNIFPYYPNLLIYQLIFCLWCSHVILLISILTNSDECRKLRYCKSMKYCYAIDQSWKQLKSITRFKYIYAWGRGNGPIETKEIQLHRMNNFNEQRINYESRNWISVLSVIQQCFVVKLNYISVFENE